MCNHDNIHSSAISFHEIDFDSSYSNSSNDLSNNDFTKNEIFDETGKDNISINQSINNKSSQKNDVINNRILSIQLSPLIQKQNDLVFEDEKQEKTPISPLSCDLYNLAMQVPDINSISNQSNYSINRSFNSLTPKTTNQTNNIMHKPSYSDSTLLVNDRKSVQFNKTILIHTIESNANPQSFRHKMVPCRKNLFGDRNQLQNKNELKYSHSKIPLIYKPRTISETKLSSPTACSEMKTLSKDPQ